MHDRGLTKIFL